MEALILGGALNSGPLRKISCAQYEAGINIAGRPMIDYVISALKNVPVISRIIVVCDESVLSETIKKQVTLIIKPGKTLLDSLNNGLRVMDSREPVLVLTADIPLISREALEDFLLRCKQKEADVYYSFVPKEVNDQKYPGVKRTYVKLREGVFTGGNLVLLSSEVIRNHTAILNKAVLLRKKTIQLCLMLGWKYLFYLLVGRLTIRQIEEQVAKILKIKAIGVISSFPEVGIDVDKPSDFHLVSKALSKICKIDEFKF
jgi:GTP:adenosylcobinamide-phosphate guanylyltransferase